MAFRSGRQTFRQQQRELAQAELAHDQTVADSKLADPTVHQVVKDGILRRRAWAEQAAAYVPPKRDRVVRPVDGKPAQPLEAEVIKGVGQLLNVHPKVLFAVRQNTGAMPYTNNAGKDIPVWFYRVVKAPGLMTIVDYWGFLADRRPFAFECKRQSWTGKTLDERELRQQVFLHMIRSLGGVANFITDPQQIVELLA